MNKRILIILVAALVGFAGLVALTKQKEAESASAVKRSDNVYGKMDSPVQLTEYVDFQCEACYAFYPNVKAVKEIYKDKVKFQIKYFPIASSHANALAAAAAAEAAAKQDKFFEMHDILFERQKEWQNRKDRQVAFEGYAKEIGLDMEQYKKDFVSKETTATIQADLEEVQKLGGNGTPTFALNGKKIESPRNSVGEISKLLDEALDQSGK